MKMKKMRESNMELFRILAMFLVLVVHADFLALGSPKRELYVENSTLFFGQFFFESLAIGCVNMFVLISGWFGIRASIKGFLNILFQGLFFSIGIFIVMILLGKTELSYKGLLFGGLRCFWLFGENWFIKAYIGLYLLAPVLNAFIENTGRRSLEYFLLAFFVFQTLYGWLFPGVQFFVGGYSTISFIGLYMLARYCKLYSPFFTCFSRNIDFLMYVSIVVIITLVASISVIFEVNYIRDIMYQYTNPLVITASLYLLLYFSKLDIGHIPLVNTVAASTFAVYLLHIDPNILSSYFRPFIKDLAMRFDGFIFLLVVFGGLLLIYIVSIVLDQIRIFLWNKLLPHIIKE